jgi:hypothetical protein
VIAPNGDEMYEDHDESDEDDGLDNNDADDDALADVRPAPRRRTRRCSYPVRPIESHRREQPHDLLVTTTVVVERRGDTAHARMIRIEMDGDSSLSYAAFELLFELDEHVGTFGMEVT